MSVLLDSDLENQRIEMILLSLGKLLKDPSCKRHVSFEYMEDGTVRAELRLKTGPGVGPLFPEEAAAHGQP
jgi:hypothetical protein